MVEIDATCERVWNLLVGIDDWATWRDGLVNVSVLGDPVFKTGSTWREVRSIGGIEVGFNLEVTDYIKYESLSLIVNGDNSGLGTNLAFFEFRVIDYDSTTTVHLDSKRDKPKGIRSLFSKSPAEALLELYRSDLLRLKERAEQVG